MKETPFRGLWALVTGASSGMGKDYASLLAAQGCHLILTARRESALQDLAEQLRVAHGIQVEVKPGDLSKAEFRKALVEELSVAGKGPDILINNTLYQRLFMMPSEPVARLGLKALAKNKPSVIPGLLNKLMAQSLRLMPRRLQAEAAYQLMRNE